MTCIIDFNIFDSRSYDPNEVIELDRFVHTLTGEARETIVRTSNQAASTLKYSRILSINELARQVQIIVQNPGAPIPSSYCGIPHHLLLPRQDILNSLCNITNLS